MTRTLLLTISLFAAFNTWAQEFRITGEVCNALTQEGVNRAVVRLMATDSTTVLASDTTHYRLITEKGDNWINTYADKYSGAIFFFRHSEV